MMTLITLKGRLLKRVFITLDGRVYELGAERYVNPSFAFVTGLLDEENNILFLKKVVNDFNLENPNLYFPERQYVK